MHRYQLGVVLCAVILAVTVQSGVGVTQSSTSKAINKFAFSMYSALRLSNRDGNVAFSPVSISSAFSVIYVGARGRTREEMEKVFLFGNSVGQNALNPSTLVSKGSDGAKLSLSNSVYLEETFPVSAGFLSNVRDWESVPLVRNPENARRLINERVEEDTNGNIVDLLPPNSISIDTRLVVANAMFFKAAWLHPFKPEDTAMGEFLGAKGPVRWPFMKLKARLAYGRRGEGGTADMEVVELPYRDGQFSMFIVLPKKRSVELGLAPIENALADKPELLFEGLYSTSVILELPRFELEDTIDLEGPLTGLGVGSLFSLMQSDLSGISKRRGLHVTTAIHRSKITVDEEGTTAAAATGIVASIRSLQIPVVFKCDHPFVFVIRDNTKGVIVFLGSVTNPE